MWLSKGEFKNFMLSVDLRISNLQSEVNTLKDWLNEERKEKEEFKTLLFRNMGIIKEINEIPKEQPKPIPAPKSWSRQKVELEQAEREKAWAAKSAPIEETRSVKVS